MPPTIKRNIQSIERNFANNLPLFQHRERVTIADVNAGYTLLPAVPNHQYRISEMAMIAVGGAGGAATDVRILATQAAASVALLITALAALTRSAVNYPGLANNTVLADGASYVENDVNTAITVGKTGASLTTATHIDFAISYVLVPTRQGA